MGSRASRAATGKIWAMGKVEGTAGRARSGREFAGAYFVATLALALADGQFEVFGRTNSGNLVCHPRGRGLGPSLMIRCSSRLAMAADVLPTLIPKAEAGDEPSSDAFGNWLRVFF